LLLPLLYLWFLPELPQNCIQSSSCCHKLSPICANSVFNYLGT
jgi:hypothetical protein